MPTAAQVLATLRRDGWVQVRQRGSHRRLEKGDRAATFAFHDNRDLGKVELSQVARAFGYTVDELREMV